MLVCTTIVESGLDMPTVNTLVVDRADRLGLAQLYQLRGRVGRRGQRAYAYLLYPSDHKLSEKLILALSGSDCRPGAKPEAGTGQAGSLPQGLLRRRSR